MCRTDAAAWGLAWGSGHAPRRAVQGSITRSCDLTGKKAGARHTTPRHDGPPSPRMCMRGGQGAQLCLGVPCLLSSATFQARWLCTQQQTPEDARVPSLNTGSSTASQQYVRVCVRVPFLSGFVHLFNNILLSLANLTSGWEYSLMVSMMRLSVKVFCLDGRRRNERRARQAHAERKQQQVSKRTHGQPSSAWARLCQKAGVGRSATGAGAAQDLSPPDGPLMQEGSSHQSDGRSSHVGATAGTAQLTLHGSETVAQCPQRSAAATRRPMGCCRGAQVPYQPLSVRASP